MTPLPAEDEPDGDIWLPHHFWIGGVVMLGGWLYWGTDPAGAWLTLAGLLIVADDVISHVFGVPTPLDALFKRALRNPRFRRAYTRLLRSYR